MRDLIVVGCGGHGRDVASTALLCGRTVRGFLDDSGDVTSVLGRPVLGKSTDWCQFADCSFVVGIGDSRIRRLVVSRMAELGEPSWDIIVHPSLISLTPPKIGAGTVVFPGCIFATEVTVGQHCTISWMVSLGHDDTIGDFSTLLPKAALSGNVTCEPGVEIGTSAAVRQGVTLRRGSLLGMGGILLKDADANHVYVGNPARPMKALSPF